ncbi:glycosyltransferase family 2 protein [Plastoroseomonas arctica]|uniref:Glycosyltransferase family 2 protein n=1 Tax=Plastoroseomonas arctica TaxID=1509237 RepID=A0AAF1KHU6_9PROT|nr:glycosyltransferase family 2 protein [Plastoroseomonas arctica]MBR0654344.1 glycosyltransferase family 2 protein [Plastoroseomonas arctica]
MNVIDPVAANQGDITGRVRLEQSEDGARLTGWALGEADVPGEPPEIAIQVPGLGLRTLAAWPLAPDAEALPDGACGFTWHLPSSVRDGVPRELRVWNLATGLELAGSPIAVGRGAAVQANEAEAPLARWDAPLTGHVSAGDPVELAPGLFVAAEPPARSLRYELVVGDPMTADTAPERGIRILADAPSGRIALHFPLAPLMPTIEDTPALLQLRAWLPQATQRAMQAQAELWLMVFRFGGFEKLRRLRRVRVFRRPSLITAQITLSEEDFAAGALWLGVEALNARGLAAMPPRIVAPAGSSAAGMEDQRLHSAFDALAELVRVHGEAAMPTHALLPAMPPAAGQSPCVAAGDAHPFTQVILPVYNGDDIVRGCLRALRAAGTGPFQVLIVDDGSRGFTAEMLRREVAGDPRFILHRRDTNRGYTKSINEAVALTQAPWVVVLNSDTVVPHGWLDRLHAAARARPGTGMVGPLSNAATWQSIPEVKRPDGSWSVNDMIEPEHLDAVQRLLDEVSTREYPEFPVLNGFCTLIARTVLDRIGAYDEEAFPMGYGEETDLCLRARRAGFRLTLADDAFVYHHKSLSFGAAGRSPLTRAGGLEMTNKHLGVNIAALERTMQSCPALVRVRARMLDRLKEIS